MQINLGIQFDKVLKFNRNFWVMVGSWVANTIRADAKVGVFQTDEAWKKTYSKQYAQLKRNRMKPPLKNGKPGKTLKTYEGVSITSDNTSFVDMTLTGQTLRDLKIKKADDKGVTVGFEPRDIWKIVGNQKPGLNRRLVGLNQKNQDELQTKISKYIETNIKQAFTGKVTINIKL